MNVVTTRGRGMGGGRILSSQHIRPLYPLGWKIYLAFRQLDDFVKLFAKKKGEGGKFLAALNCYGLRKQFADHPLLGF